MQSTEEKVSWAESVTRTAKTNEPGRSRRASEHTHFFRSASKATNLKVTMGQEQVLASLTS